MAFSSFFEGKRVGKNKFWICATAIAYLELKLLNREVGFRLPSYPTRSTE